MLFFVCVKWHRQSARPLDVHIVVQSKMKTRKTQKETDGPPTCMDRIDIFHYGTSIWFCETNRLAGLRQSPFSYSFTGWLYGWMPSRNYMALPEQTCTFLYARWNSVRRIYSFVTLRKSSIRMWFYLYIEPSVKFPSSNHYVFRFQFDII